MFCLYSFWPSFSCLRGVYKQWRCSPVCSTTKAIAMKFNNIPNDRGHYEYDSENANHPLERGWSSKQYLLYENPVFYWACKAFRTMFCISVRIVFAEKAKALLITRSHDASWHSNITLAVFCVLNSFELLIDIYSMANINKPKKKAVRSNLFLYFLK